MCSLFRCSGQGHVVYSMWALKNTHVYSRSPDQTPIDQAIYSLFLNYFPLSSYSECYWKAWVLLPLEGDSSSCVCRIIWISIWSASKKRGQFLPSASSWAFLPQSLSLLVAAALQRSLCWQILMEAEEWVWGKSGDVRIRAGRWRSGWRVNVILVREPLQPWPWHGWHPGKLQTLEYPEGPTAAALNLQGRLKCIKLRVEAQVLLQSSDRALLCIPECCAQNVPQQLPCALPGQAAPQGTLA